MKSKYLYEVSIIVPVYNGEKYLSELLDSILESTEKNLQIILIDDGSEDNSGRICERYVEKYDNVLYYHKENGGIVSARNMGLDLAEGEYICFCDQDDLIDKDTYRKMLEKADKEKSDIVICGTARYLKNEKLPLEQFEDKTYREYEIKKEIIEPVLFYGSDLGKPASDRRVGSIWKCMIRRKLIQSNNIRFRRYVNYEDDLLFFLDTALHADIVSTISHIGYMWRVNLDSETYNWKYVSDYESKYEDFLRDVSDMLVKEKVDKSVIENYRNYQLCTLVDLFIVNEGSTRNLKNTLEKGRYIKNTLRQDKFRNALVFRNHIRKTSIRKNVTLSLVAHKLYIVALMWSVSYKRIRERAIKKKVWFFFENVIKRGV